MQDWDITSVYITVATTAESDRIANTYHSQGKALDGTALCGNREMMMAKYIDADTVVGLMQFDDYGRTVETDTIENILDNFTEDGCPESADVVPVVRCRDCKHWKSYYGRCYKHDEYGMASDDFCSYGERREKGGIM